MLVQIKNIFTFIPLEKLTGKLWNQSKEKSSFFNPSKYPDFPSP
jgi:hypothetical protein